MGVLFGAHLTDRSQRGLQRSGQRYEYLRWRETVFADFLVAYNQMRRLLVSTSVQEPATSRRRIRNTSD